MFDLPDLSVQFIAERKKYFLLPSTLSSLRELLIASRGRYDKISTTPTSGGERVGGAGLTVTPTVIKASFPYTSPLETLLSLPPP